MPQSPQTIYSLRIAFIVNFKAVMDTSLDTRKILIVEDEEIMLNLLGDALEKKGCVVFRANNGEDGLKLALSESPDLILLDILLPKIDGLQVLKKIREGAEAIKDVPVILLTNLNPDKEEINQTITQTYPAYYLVKSNWNVDDVIDKVRERLSRK